MFCDRLRELRIKYNLTQAQLAEDLDVERTTVSAWETGKLEPATKRLLQIADMFTVTTDYLLDRRVVSIDISYLDKDEVHVLSGIISHFQQKKKKEYELQSGYKKAE